MCNLSKSTQRHGHVCLLAFPHLEHSKNSSHLYGSEMPLVGTLCACCRFDIFFCLKSVFFFIFENETPGYTVRRHWTLDSENSLVLKVAGFRNQMCNRLCARPLDIVTGIDKCVSCSSSPRNLLFLCAKETTNQRDARKLAFSIMTCRFCYASLLES